MNWLAHVFLSEPAVEHRLGNLLADIVRGEARAAMSAAFQRGARTHHAIDAFTDAHPIVRRSRARLSKVHRRFSGVLVDVFYDHLLALHWRQYAPSSLQEFTQTFYADARAARITLPEPAQQTLTRIIQHDILGSYRDIAGVERSLHRLSLMLSARWRRPFALETAVQEFAADLEAYSQDFQTFFPELQAHLEAHLPSR